MSGFRAKTGYTFTDSEILESTSTNALFKVGNWAFRRPRHSGFLNLAWTGARASVDLARHLLRRARRQRLLVPPAPHRRETTGSRSGICARPPGSRKMFSLTGAIDNLTDSDRMEPLGYPVLGRAIRFGVRARF